MNGLKNICSLILLNAGTLLSLFSSILQLTTIALLVWLPSVILLIINDLQQWKVGSHVPALPCTQWSQYSKFFIVSNLHWWYVGYIYIELYLYLLTELQVCKYNANNSN